MWMWYIIISTISCKFKNKDCSKFTLMGFYFKFRYLYKFIILKVLKLRVIT